MHNDACYFVLATMNFNCFKDFMEKRHYINKKKKACMLDMYGIIIFFFFFFLLAWKWTFEDVEHAIRTFVLVPHDFFEFRTKKCNPRTFFPWKFASAPKPLWVPQNFSLHCQCTEGIPVTDTRMGYKFNMANRKELECFLFIKNDAPLWGLKSCCCQKAV